MRTAPTLALLALLTASNVSASNPTVTQSKFDGATHVSIADHGGSCGWSIVCAGLGAQWDGAKPDVVLLEVVLYNDIKAIESFALNIDGEVIELKNAVNMTEFDQTSNGSYYKESAKYFATDLSTVEKLVAAKRVAFRLHTSGGYIEGMLTDPELKRPQTKATLAMQRLLAEISRHRKPVLSKP